MIWKIVLGIVLTGLPVFALVSSNPSLGEHLNRPETWTWSLTTVYSWSYGVPVFLLGFTLLVSSLARRLDSEMKSKTLL